MSRRGQYTTGLPRYLLPGEGMNMTVGTSGLTDGGMFMAVMVEAGGFREA